MSEDTEMLRRIALANAETAHLLLRISAMNAENQQRSATSNSPAYVEQDYQNEHNLHYIHNLLKA